MPGIATSVAVVGRNKNEYAEGLVRVQFEIQARGFVNDLMISRLQVGIVVPGSGRVLAYDQASPYDLLHPQSAAHTSLALRPGTCFKVFGVASYIENQGHIYYLGSFIVPNEDVYNSRYGNRPIKGYSNLDATGGTISDA